MCLGPCPGAPVWALCSWPAAASLLPFPCCFPTSPPTCLPTPAATASHPLPLLLPTPVQHCCHSPTCLPPLPTAANHHCHSTPPSCLLPLLPLSLLDCHSPTSCLLLLPPFPTAIVATLPPCHFPTCGAGVRGILCQCGSATRVALAAVSGAHPHASTTRAARARLDTVN